MNCKYCGSQLPYGAKFCSDCGHKTDEREYLPTAAYDSQPIVTPLYQKTLSAIGSGMFLAACILVSVGTLFTFSVIHILLTIFMWLLYSQGRKGVADARHLRCISGTIFAQYVIRYVILGCCALISLLFIAYPTVINSTFLKILETFGAANLGDALIQYNVLVLSWVVGIIFLLIVVVGFVFNICGYRKIHLFFKTLHTNVASGCDAELPVSGAAAWMMVFGIFAGIGALSSLGENLWGFIGSGSISAAFIIGNRILVKYFK